MQAGGSVQAGEPEADGDAYDAEGVNAAVVLPAALLICVVCCVVGYFSHEGAAAKTAKFCLVDSPDILCTVVFLVWCTDHPMGTAVVFFAALAAVAGLLGYLALAASTGSEAKAGRAPEWLALGGPFLSLVSDLLSATAMFIEDMDTEMVPKWLQVMNYLFSSVGILCQLVELIVNCRPSARTAPY